ncbi:LysR family transcriptional regulator [Gemmobacter lutimaris]|uniref:LysR family transcriptional regulator n=1 Tax=Gemmobacter lutimaris TaxID=2306023 RepID=A0A398BPX5_9RHOB|nr:LysR family transcriptional regulator [Gemmobacter lutimaris]RID92605.1 LysR family transcriptional regulator [Gemmobacter lutimaris]
MTENQSRISLWGVEVFLAAAEAGSISAAARRLGASASTISQQLAALEATLGTVLLDRGARPMKLTSAGRVFLRHARAMLDSATAARAELALADLSGLPRLRLGVIEDLDSDVTPRLLAALAAQFRNSRFLLETGASHRLLDQLSARALDMVVTADPGLARSSEPGEETYPLLAEPFVVALPQGTPAGDLAETLRGLPLIHYSARHLMGRQIAAHLAGQNLTLAHRFELDSYHAILAMVAAGQGWTILTPLALHHAARFLPEVVVQPLPFGALERRIVLSARSGALQTMPGQVRKHVQALLAEAVIAPALMRWPWLDGQLRLL